MYGSTVGCSLRLTEQTISPQNATSIHGLRGDAWFGSVKAASQMAVRGYQCCFQIKVYSALYPKEFIEDVLKDAPGGVCIALEGKAPNEQNLIALGYRYSRKATLFFVMTPNAGSTFPGFPYEMKYTDDYGNVQVRNVSRPDVLSKYFQSSNVIDIHNQLRQGNLALEEKWSTQNCWFRLATTLIGMCVTDTYLLAKHHRVVDQQASINVFAGKLGYQLVSKARMISGEASQYLPEYDDLTVMLSPSQQYTISTMTESRNLDVAVEIPPETKIISRLIDTQNRIHTLVRYPMSTGTNGKRRTLARKCNICPDCTEIDGTKKRKRDSLYYCYECDVTCYNTKEYDCFRKHVEAMRRVSQRVENARRFSTAQTVLD